MVTLESNFVGLTGKLFSYFRYRINGDVQTIKTARCLAKPKSELFHDKMEPSVSSICNLFSLCYELLNFA